MKLMITLCLLAFCQSASLAELKGKAAAKTEKRALEEGNANVAKRAPDVSSVSPSPAPGIVYADAQVQQTLSDKSPSQQVYAAPVPQVAKISDVLTGQGHNFPTAIEGHLYSPFQVYQAKIGSPTAYQVSAPIPAQLAYTEHKVYQQPQQNSLQYFEQRKQQPQQRLAVNYSPQQHIQQPQVYLQQQPIVYQQQQNRPQIVTAPQILQYTQQGGLNLQQPLIYRQQPVAYNQQPLAYNQQQVTYNQQPIAYNQQPLAYNQQPLAYNQQSLAYNQQPLAYNQQPLAYNQQPVVYNQQAVGYNQNQVQTQIPLLQQIQPVVYTTQGQTIDQKYISPLVQQTTQRDIKTLQVGISADKSGQQINNDKAQGAVSYASFSQNQGSTNSIGPSNTILPPQQPSNYISPNTKLEAPVQTQNQSPILKPITGSALPVSSLPRQAAFSYFRPQFLQSVPQLINSQQQFYALPQGGIFQNQGFLQQPVAVAPSYAPVQYFGKFAPAIFGVGHQ